MRTPLDVQSLLQIFVINGILCMGGSGTTSTSDDECIHDSDIARFVVAVSSAFDHRVACRGRGRTLLDLPLVI